MNLPHYYSITASDFIELRYGLAMLCTRSQRVPFGAKVLLVLTTSSWDQDATTRLDPENSARVKRMLGTGWWIRRAYQRNYVLWRNGHIMRNTRLPILVLPQPASTVREDEAVAFLSAELVRAELRVAGIFPPYTAELEDRIEDAMNSSLASRGEPGSAWQLRACAEKKFTFRRFDA